MESTTFDDKKRESLPFPKEGEYPHFLKKKPLPFESLVDCKKQRLFVLHLPIGIVVSVIRNPFFGILWSEWNIITTWSPVTVTVLPVLSPQYIPNVSFTSLVIFK